MGTVPATDRNGTNRSLDASTLIDALLQAPKWYQIRLRHKRSISAYAKKENTGATKRKTRATFNLSEPTAKGYCKARRLKKDGLFELKVGR